MSSEGGLGMLLALDGPAGAGKGTIARRLGEITRWQVLDTGLYYRAAASLYLEYGGDPLLCADRLTKRDLRRYDLRTPKVDTVTPVFSDKLAIRLLVNRFLRQQMSQGGDWIMDGRAGAYEFPDAEVKIFLQATSTVRAERRFEHTIPVKEGCSVEDIKAALESRDRQDAERGVCPLQFNPLHYHALVDSTHHRSIEQTVQVVENLLHTILIEQLYQ